MVEVLRRVRGTIRNLLTARAICTMVLVVLGVAVVVAVVKAAPIIVTVIGAATGVVTAATEVVTAATGFVTIVGTATVVVTRARAVTRGLDVPRMLAYCGHWRGVMAPFIQRMRDVGARGGIAVRGRVTGSFLPARFARSRPIPRGLLAALRIVTIAAATVGAAIGSTIVVPRRWGRRKRIVTTGA